MDFVSDHCLTRPNAYGWFHNAPPRLSVAIRRNPMFFGLGGTDSFQCNAAAAIAPCVWKVHFGLHNSLRRK